MAQKIDDTLLMSFEDFSELTVEQQEKVPHKARIKEIERLRLSSEAQLGLTIRDEIMEFAQDEIRPLVTVEEAIVKTEYETEEETIDALNRAKAKVLVDADNKAFLLALKLFMVHDIRFKGELTLDFISALLGVTKERIRQIETKALKTLKNPKISRQMVVYLNESSFADETTF